MGRRLRRRHAHRPPPATSPRPGRPSPRPPLHPAAAALSGLLLVDTLYTHMRCQASSSSTRYYTYALSGLLLVDTCPTPPRAYLASLGAGRAFACCKQDGQAARAVPLGRPHSAADAKEKGRLAKAGATASGGLVCGLPVSRSLGDGAAKRAAPGVLLPTPDVSSFDISAAQRFVRPPQPPAEMRRDAERRR